MSANTLIHDPVPKNASKYPIHQTYLTVDAVTNNNGVYKFKAPEVWSSARSGKKSIAIRSIRWLSKTFVLQFAIRFSITDDGGNIVNKVFPYKNTTPSNMAVTDVLVDIRVAFSQWVTTANDVDGYRLMADLDSNDNKLTMSLIDEGGYEKSFRITDLTNIVDPSTSFNQWLNQPLNYFPAASTKLVYNNVWDRTTALNFHASFIPFDNYQYLGAIFDNWNSPIIYQDPNASPLFNIWITTDMKTPINLLYEQFAFRFTFIIDSDGQYRS